MTDFEYMGAEMELFAEVHNWKTYWASQLQPFICGDVLEVGAGIGANTPFLCPGTKGRWVCLEPDHHMFCRLTKMLGDAGCGEMREAICGTLASLQADQRFNTILYVDVLEHIENDWEELQRASAHLYPGGRIIVLAPAHQKLFTPFDSAIGHFRRYDQRMLRDLSPRGLFLERLLYLDSAGLVLSAANAVLLRQAMPTKAQLAIWDRWVIPVSRRLDKCLRHSIGKSIIGIWKRID